MCLPALVFDAASGNCLLVRCSQLGAEAIQDLERFGTCFLSWMDYGGRRPRHSRSIGLGSIARRPQRAGVIGTAGRPRRYRL
jgi:hypothetical protein